MHIITHLRTRVLYKVVLVSLKTAVNVSTKSTFTYSDASILEDVLMPVEKKTIIANGLLFILSNENAYKRVIPRCRTETKVPEERF